MNNMLKLLFIFIFSSFFLSCSSTNTNTETAEDLFKAAKKFEESERYQVALQKYNDIRIKFPYSTFATEAKLAIADVHFKNYDYPEAQISYQNFRELHPRHPKSDYVIYQIGMSYYQQLPETFDRDISLANDAIYNYNDLIKRFPNSEYLIKAKEYREKAFIMLNEKELYIADFYFSRNQFDSALSRYESALNKFPGFGFEPRGLLGAIKSSAKLSNDDKQKKYTDQLIAQFPESAEAKQLKKVGL